MSKSNQASSDNNTEARDEFDRIISEAQVESESMDSEIAKLGESAKQFAQRHGEGKND